MEQNQASKLYNKIELELQKLRKNNSIVAIYELLNESGFSPTGSLYVNLGDEIERHPDVLFYNKIVHGVQNWLAAEIAKDLPSK
jgi:hypothetical protein